MLMHNNLVDLVHSLTLNTFHHFLFLAIKQNIYGIFKINHYWIVTAEYKAYMVSNESSTIGKAGSVVIVECW